MKSELLKDIGIALVSVLLAILFELISLRVSSPASFDEWFKSPHGNEEVLNHNKVTNEVIDKVLGVQFDLWLIGLSLFFGAQLNRVDKKGSEFVVLVFVGLLLLILALEAVSPYAGDKRATFAVVLPDLLGLVAIGVAVIAVRPRPTSGGGT